MRNDERRGVPGIRIAVSSTMRLHAVVGVCGLAILSACGPGQPLHLNPTDSLGVGLGKIGATVVLSPALVTYGVLDALATPTPEGQSPGVVVVPQPVRPSPVTCTTTCLMPESCTTTCM